MKKGFAEWQKHETETYISHRWLCVSFTGLSSDF